jgi:DNA-binding MarR family transcriptional regulator
LSMAKTEIFTADDYRALAEFRYQIRRFLHYSEGAARAAGRSPQHHQLLLAVKGIPAGVRPTINEVAARLHIRHHSAVELTNRLTARRLIRKRQDDSDRRRVLLEITPFGEALLRKLSVIHHAQLQSAGKDLIRSLEELLTHNEGLHETTRSRKNNNKRTR